MESKERETERDTQTWQAHFEKLKKKLWFPRWTYNKIKQKINQKILQSVLWRKNNWSEYIWFLCVCGVLHEFFWPWWFLASFFFCNTVLACVLYNLSSSRWIPVVGRYVVDSNLTRIVESIEVEKQKCQLKFEFNMENNKQANKAMPSPVKSRLLTRCQIGMTFLLI